MVLGPIIISIHPMRKLRPTEVKKPVQSHAMRSRRVQSEPRLPGSRPALLAERTGCRAPGVGRETLQEVAGTPLVQVLFTDQD